MRGRALQPRGIAPSSRPSSRTDVSQWTLLRREREGPRRARKRAKLKAWSRGSPNTPEGRCSLPVPRRRNLEVRTSRLIICCWRCCAKQNRSLAFGRLIARKRCGRSEEHTSELQLLRHLVCRLLLEKK